MYKAGCPDADAVQKSGLLVSMRITIFLSCSRASRSSSLGERPAANKRIGQARFDPVTAHSVERSSSAGPVMPAVHERTSSRLRLAPYSLDTQRLGRDGVVCALTSSAHLYRPRLGGVLCCQSWREFARARTGARPEAIAGRACTEELRRRLLLGAGAAEGDRRIQPDLAGARECGVCLERVGLGGAGAAAVRVGPALAA
jgi:hypothetical protein